MRFTINQYGQALYEAFQDINPQDYDRVIANFIDILKRNGDLAHYEKIISAYEDIDRKERGAKTVEVATAREMKVNQELIGNLNDWIGGTAEIKQKVDENLIGGVVIKVDDTLLDGSVKGQLDKLKKKLAE